MQGTPSCPPLPPACFSWGCLASLGWLIAWRPHLPLQGHPAVAPKVPRRLKPRTPLDCPACWPPAPFSTLHSPVRAPIRPWREVKSRRGAPKRIPTQGFACPMPTCLYYQITDAYVHALGRGRVTRQRRTHSDLSLSVLPHDLRRPPRHPAVPPQNSGPSSRRSAHRAVRRPGCG
jgi:hypothetical protein